MPIKYYPNQVQNWQVSYGPDGTGDILRSFNVSLTTLPGKISTVRRVQPHTTSDTAAVDFPPSSFVRANPVGTLRYWAYWNTIWLTTTQDTAFGGDAFPGTPSDTDGDLAVFGRTAATQRDILFATTGQDLTVLNTDINPAAWTTNYWTVTLGQPILDILYPTILKRFASNSQDLLFVGNGNVVHSIDLQGNVVYNRLVFYADYECNWIQCTKDRVYIGFKNKNDATRPSYVVEYDPLTETDNPVINQNGQTIGFIYQNICLIVDIKGWIAQFNSNGFTNVAAFPIAYIDGIRMTPPHRNGVTLIDGRPHFLIPSIPNGDTKQSFSQIMPAGIWCWEPDTGRLYHKGSLARSNQVQNSYGDANSGSRINVYGALYALPSTDAKSQDFFAGGQVSFGPGSLSSVVGIFSTVVVQGVSTFNNRGWIVTPKLYSKDINAIFRNIVTQYDPNQYPLGRQSGALVVKYRVRDPIDDMGSYRIGTWNSETEFDVSTTTITNLAVGDEIFVLFGMGAGLSVHVLLLTDLGGGMTRVTIDENPNLNPSGDMAFFYENWIKLVDEKYPDGLIDDNTENTWQTDVPEEANSTWIQFKIEIRATGKTPFRGMSMEEITVGYQENLEQEGSQRDNH